jgi:hypothetical protein
LEERKADISQNNDAVLHPINIIDPIIQIIEDANE